MSSYIVDDQCINRMLAAAELYVQCNLAEVPPPPRDIMDDWPQGGGHMRVPDRCDWAILGQSLRDMNVAAVIARYGPSEPFPGPSPLLPYQYQSIMAPSAIQAIKSLACYLYQCSEGAIPGRPLYQQLCKWGAALHQHYIEKSDEWQRAEWG